MADREGSSSAPWLAFLVGIVLVGIVGFGIYAYSGGNLQPQRQAQLEVNMPDVKMNPPDVHLPSPPPAPVVPPSADNTAPAEPAPTTP